VFYPKLCGSKTVKESLISLRELISYPYIPLSSGSREQAMFWSDQNGLPGYPDPAAALRLAAPKMARPIKSQEEKLSVRLAFRMTIAEEKKLLQSAIVCGRTPSVLIREKLFNGRFPQPKSARLEVETYRELKKIGTNLNQLAKRVNTGFLPATLLPILQSLMKQQESIICLLVSHDSQSENR
jgi:Bacterial mobilisation protein (MobC)